ncbi:hypothetical protein [Flavobacterium hungaricum]|uniref:Lipoprotein n=1 Tax=Flavobacterium hungaricum TaxID=2082725 RepID=A0ABR9TEV6_9FLAO|nr:hypothetical protein [Flavobacterium hungaricum]MBE8723884.1 hypothetical protein [Flavobacterium hungaricum]
MKITFKFLIIIALLISCTGKSIKNNDKTVKKIDYSNRSISHNAKEKFADSLSIDTLSTMMTEYGGIKFYTEDNLRGDGVVQISIDSDLEILNFDKTVYGSIKLTNNAGEPFSIKLPKSVIAREIIPNVEYRIFCFDAEKPEKDNDFLIVYINREKRLISKKKCNYKFNSWEEYIKTAFIHLTSKVENSSKEEKKYYYAALRIKGDSMQVKSVAKTACDYVEEYKDVTRWIKWKENSCKLITFDFCY